MVRILSALLVVLFVAPASAQTFIEWQAHAVDNGITPYIDGQYVHPSSGKSNFYTFGLVTEGFGEILVGKQVQATAWLNVGISAGLETSKDPGVRFSPKVYAEKNGFYAFAVAEYGPSGGWYQFRAAYKANPKLDVGIHSQQGYGTGPYVRYYGMDKFSLWASIDVRRPGTFAIGVIRTLN